MGVVVKSREGKILFTSSDYKELANDYNHVMENVDLTKGSILLDMRTKVAHGDVEKLWTEIGMTRGAVNRYIRMYQGFVAVSNGSSTDQLKIGFPETVAQYSELVGDTPEEKVECWDAVVEATGESQPSARTTRATISEEQYNVNLANRNRSEAARTQAIAQLEFDTTDLEYSSMLVEGMSVWDSLLDYSEEWKAYKKLFFKVAHPDMEGGSVGASQFLAVLDNVYTIARKDEKVASRLEQVKLRTQEILRGGQL